MGVHKGRGIGGFAVRLHGGAARVYGVYRGHMECIWGVYGMYVGVYGMYMGCIWDVYGVYMGCIWAVWAVYGVHLTPSK